MNDIDYKSGKIKTVACVLCGRKFVHKTSASRHMKTCKGVKGTPRSIIQESPPKRRIATPNDFGKEDISYMFKDMNALNKYLYKCIKLREEGLCNLFLKKHFSLVNTKNKNVRYNKAEKKVEIFAQHKWNIIDNNDVLNTLLLPLREIFALLKPYKFIEEDGMVIDYLRRFIRFIAKPLSWKEIPEWQSIISKYRSSYVLAENERDKEVVELEMSNYKELITSMLIEVISSQNTE